MCPLWPLHIILMYLMALCPLWYVACQVVNKAASAATSWDVIFTPSEINALKMGSSQTVHVTTPDFSNNELDNRVIMALIQHPEVASIPTNEQIFFMKNTGYGENWADVWKAAFNVSGDFLGKTTVKLCQVEREAVKKVAKDEPPQCVKESSELKISVIRDAKLIDKLFTTSVIFLVSIIFINFGCALDFQSLKQALVRPVGPVIGLLSHFVFLPLASFVLGLYLFPDSSALRLGLFFTGISPAGGASNIWTCVLGGNINMSVTMTAVSTLASFAMIPFWVYSLGPQIFVDGHMGVPHMKILTSAVGLLIPLVIGVLLQCYCKRFSAIMVRILKPFSAVLIVFIVIFACVTNSYLFQLFKWEILVGGFALPFLGYLFGLILAVLMCQTSEDRIAIAVEAGVQNTGIAIFLLRFCLVQPDADLTTVAPVAVALMTPIPLLILYLIRRCTHVPQDKKNFNIEEAGLPSTRKSDALLAKY